MDLVAKIVAEIVRLLLDLWITKEEEPDTMEVGQCPGDLERRLKDQLIKEGWIAPHAD